MLIETFLCQNWMGPLALTLALILLSLIYYEYSLGGLPPFPVHPIPVLGNLLNMDKNPRKQLKSWRKKFGNVYSLYFGPTLVIVINGYDVIKEALVKHADKLSDRPVVFYDVASDTVNLGIVGSSGPAWKEERTQAVRILKEFGMGKNILAEKINEEISYFLKELDKLDGKPTYLNPLMSLSIANTIISILIGKRFDHEDKTFNRLISLVHRNFSLLSANAIVNFMPSLMYLPGDLFKAKEMKSDIAEVMGMLEHYVQIMADSTNTAKNDNYISFYLVEMEKKANVGHQTYMSKKNLKKSITDLFAGGFETSSVTLMWWLVYMIQYPDVQNKAFNEIKREIGLERRPRIGDKINVKYITAMIMETQRLASVAPLSVMHCCSSDLKFRGFTIPKGANIATNMDSLLLDEDIWGEDANVFKPERFLDQDGNVRQFEEFLPFSIGKRACPGESLAKMQLFLFATNMLQSFQIQAEDPDFLANIEGDFGLTYCPQKFNVCMIRRKHS